MEIETSTEISSKLHTAVADLDLHAAVTKHQAGVQSAVSDALVLAGALGHA
jgi:hypothetical protein